mgnify:FL=1
MTTTHYCRWSACDGFDGFPVRWTEPSLTEPAYPTRDTCPYCEWDMLDSPIAYEDALDGLLDELADSWAVPHEYTYGVDRRELLTVIQRELKRQRRDREWAVYERNRQSLSSTFSSGRRELI